MNGKSRVTISECNHIIRFENVIVGKLVLIDGKLAIQCVDKNRHTSFVRQSRYVSIDFDELIDAVNNVDANRLQDVSKHVGAIRNPA